MHRACFFKVNINLDSSVFYLLRHQLFLVRISHSFLSLKLYERICRFINKILWKLNFFSQVGSRRVVQWAAFFMLLFGILAKMGAVFVSIPDPIYGGVFIIMFGKICRSKLPLVEICVIFANFFHFLQIRHAVWSWIIQPSTRWLELLSKSICRGIGSILWFRHSFLGRKTRDKNSNRQVVQRTSNKIKNKFFVKSTYNCKKKYYSTGIKFFFPVCNFLNW